MPEIPTEASESGTHIHWALAHRDTTKLSLAEFKTYEQASEIEANLVELTFNPIRATKAKVYREHRLWLQDVNLKHSGQPDVFYIEGDRVLLIEYKCGWEEVEQSPRNKQMRDQAVLVFANLMTQADVICCAVIQPHVTLKPEICGYTNPDLIRAHGELLARIERSQHPDAIAHRTAGRVQCRYCRARPACEVYNRWSSEGLPLTRSLIDKPLVQWTKEDMVVFEKNYRNAMNWLELCHSHIKSAVARKPDDFQDVMVIRPGAMERPIPPENITQLHQRFLELGGTTEQLMLCLTVNKGNFEKQVATVAGVKGKSLDNLMDALYKDLTLAQQKAGSLVLKKGV